LVKNEVYTSPLLCIQLYNNSKIFDWELTFSGNANSADGSVLALVSE